MERPPGALVPPSRLKSICLNQATRFTIADRVLFPSEPLLSSIPAFDTIVL